MRPAGRASRGARAGPGEHGLHDDLRRPRRGEGLRHVRGRGDRRRVQQGERLRARALGGARAALQSRRRISPGPRGARYGRAMDGDNPLRNPAFILRAGLVVLLLVLLFGPYWLRATVPIWIPFLILAGLELNFFVGAIRAEAPGPPNRGPQPVDQELYGYQGAYEDEPALWSDDEPNEIEPPRRPSRTGAVLGGGWRRQRRSWPRSRWPSGSPTAARAGTVSTRARRPRRPSASPSKRPRSRTSRSRSSATRRASTSARSSTRTERLRSAARSRT